MSFRSRLIESTNEKKKSEQLQRGISSMELNKLEDVCIALGMKEEE